MSGRRLTRLLTRWADAHRLDARQAQAFRQTIVAESPPPDFHWWWRLLDPAAGSAFRALPFRALPTASGWATDWGATGPSFEPATAWAASLPAWTQDDDDFQPYLRLT
jgi:hypothetical protein